MKTIQGPGLFLAQFIAEQAPFNTLDGLAEWAAGLGFTSVQIPTLEPAIFDLALAARSQDYCDEIVAQSRDFSPSPLGGSELHWAGVGISLLFSPWLVLWSGSMPSNLAAVLAGGLVSLAFLQQNLGRSAANAIWVGAFEAMVLAIVALIAGLSVGTTALLVAAIVLLQNVWRPLASRLKRI